MPALPTMLPLSTAGPSSPSARSSVSISSSAYTHTSSARGGFARGGSSSFMMPYLSQSPPHRSEYFRRIFSVAQMDLEYTFAQMVYLIISPRKAYQFDSYRKQTKNQWARDDPGFVVVLGFFLVMSGLAYAAAFRLSGVRFLVAMFLPLVYFLVVGVVMARLAVGGGWLT
uniref:Uncharacterized protein n=1 Tax=Vitrella brassicaformis TaxID=1169539 RepID=A0A7S1JQ07_9ALVE|mmetsp:Transcript_16882/g.40517  ORF Transcript_16882/g.40517 Transcript_16882/m.40517 type:complete len:170 (+) Transcript_16882:94-603(+)